MDAIETHCAHPASPVTQKFQRMSYGLMALRISTLRSRLHHCFTFDILRALPHLGILKALPRFQFF